MCLHPQKYCTWCQIWSLPLCERPCMGELLFVPHSGTMQQTQDWEASPSVEGPLRTDYGELCLLSSMSASMGPKPQPTGRGNWGVEWVTHFKFLQWSHPWALWCPLHVEQSLWEARNRLTGDPLCSLTSWLGAISRPPPLESLMI